MKQPLIVPIGPRLYRLEKDYSYVWTEGDTQYKIIVPKGFEYDGASSPFWAWSLTGIRPDGLQRAAACVHDYLYSIDGEITKKNYKIKPGDKRWRGRNRKFTVLEADKLFLQILRESGMLLHKAHMMYWAVRIGARKW